MQCVSEFGGSERPNVHERSVKPRDLTNQWKMASSGSLGGRLQKTAVTLECDFRTERAEMVSIL